MRAADIVETQVNARVGAPGESIASLGTVIDETIAAVRQLSLSSQRPAVTGTSLPLLHAGTCTRRTVFQPAALCVPIGQFASTCFAALAFPWPSGGYSQLLVFDTNTEKWTTSTWQIPILSRLCVAACARNSAIFAVAHDQMIFVFNVTTNAYVSIPTETAVNQMAIAPDGSRLAWTSNNKREIWYAVYESDVAWVSHRAQWWLSTDNKSGEYWHALWFDHMGLLVAADHTKHCYRFDLAQHRTVQTLNMNPSQTAVATAIIEDRAPMMELNEPAMWIGGSGTTVACATRHHFSINAPDNRHDSVFVYDQAAVLAAAVGQDYYFVLRASGELQALDYGNAVRLGSPPAQPITIITDKKSECRCDACVVRDSFRDDVGRPEIVVGATGRDVWYINQWAVVVHVGLV